MRDTHLVDCSEEAENASELAAVAGEEPIAGLGRVGSDLLTAQTRHYIRSFADA